MGYETRRATVLWVSMLTLAGCGHMGTAGILMDDPGGAGFACEGAVGSWWNEGLKIEAHQFSGGGGPPVLGAVLGLAEAHPEAGFADSLAFEMTSAGLAVTPMDGGTALEVIMIPAEQVRCAGGRIEFERSRWHSEALAGTAIRESGTFTLAAGSGGSLVLSYLSSRKGLLLYGIPVWAGDEDIYRFPPSGDGTAASARPPEAAQGRWPPADLAALGIYGLPRARVLTVDGAPAVRSIWKRSWANAALLTPGAHELEIEVMGEVAFWSLAPPPRRVVRVRTELAGGHTYVVFGELLADDEPWVEVFDAGPDVPSSCLPELAIPPPTETCLAARGIAYPTPPTGESAP